jgi:hypothetical protein
VTQPPIEAVAKAVQDAVLGNDEAVLTASRRATRPDARKRFHAPRQQLLVAGASMAALPVHVYAPAKDIALLGHGQVVGMPDGD